MLPEIRDCERVDALRLRTPFYMLASGVALLLISLIYRSSSSALFALFLLVGVSGILEALANFLLLFVSMTAGSRWKHSSTGVAFWPLWSGTSGKYISCLVMTMSALVPGAIVISTRFTDTGSLKVLLYSIIFGAIAATMWADLPFNRPRRPAIEMDSEGIYFLALRQPFNLYRMGRLPCRGGMQERERDATRPDRIRQRAVLRLNIKSSNRLRSTQKGVVFLRSTPRTSSRACVSARSGTRPGIDVRLIE